MAFSVKTNSGHNLRVGDLNQIGNDGNIYWYIVGDCLDANTIYTTMLNNQSFTTPTYFFTDENLAKVKENDYDVVTGMNSQYYWYIGDIQRGGICFQLNRVGTGTEFYIHRVTLCDDVNTGFDWHRQTRIYPTVQIDGGGGVYVTQDTLIYPIDDFIRNGVVVDGSSGTNFGHWMEVTPNGGFGFGKIKAGETVPQYFNDNNLKMVQWQKFSVPAEFFQRPSPYMLPAASGSTVQWIDWWSGLETSKPDPNQGGGTAGGAGGNGGFDNSSDTIPVAELPPDMFLNSGVIKMYTPTVEQLQNFLQFIYTSPTSVIDNFKKIWVDPMQSIISFGIVPFSVPAGDPAEVKFCGVGATVPIMMNTLQSQYVQINCGYYVMDRYWGGALDQNNYTKVKLFLPFIGFVPINADECNGGTISVVYNVDLLSGDCMAFVHIYKNDLEEFDMELDGAIYSFKGNVLCQCPLTGNGFAGLYGSILNTVTGVGGAIVSGNPASVAGIAKEVMGQKVDVQRSSAISANSGQLGEYQPFLVIERPIQSLATDFAKFNGYPVNDAWQLANLHGFTLVDVNTFRTTDISNITGEEALELISIMNEGVVLP